MTSPSTRRKVRGAIYVGSLNGVVVACDQVRARFEVVRIKNRFGTPTFCGFRDVLLNVALPLADGTKFVAEIQVHLIRLSEVAAANRSHDHYAFFRECVIALSRGGGDGPPQRRYFAGNEAAAVEARMDTLERWHRTGVDAGAVVALCERCGDAAAFDELRAVQVLLKQMCEVGLATKVAAALAASEGEAARGAAFRPSRHAALLLDVADLAVLGGCYDGAAYAPVLAALARAPDSFQAVSGKPRETSTLSDFVEASLSVGFQA